MGDITFNIVKLSFAILLSTYILHGLTFERLLCENSEAELNCSVGDAIEDINITFHDVNDACSLTDNDYTGTIALNSTSYTSCFGHSSCVLTDKMINVSHLVADKTWKLTINYHCVRPNKRNSKRMTVCPYNTGSVKCFSPSNSIEINSVQILQYLSYCEKQTFDEHCTELIQQKVNASCNGYNSCEHNIWTKSADTWDDCIRIPKFVNILFSCKAISTVIPLKDESSTEGNIGVAVGVISGLILIVGVVVLYLLLVRRKRTDDKHITGQRNISDYVGNQNIALPANCNSEISTNLELRIIDPKQTNKSETVLENGNRTKTDSQYYNSTNFSTALEPNRTGFLVQHSNANDYETAKPINDSKIYDKNITQAEKDSYAFNEDQYDIAGKIDVFDYQQGIYSRALDTMYDSASHSRQKTATDEIYDHAFGPTTEDDYNIAKH